MEKMNVSLQSTGANTQVINLLNSLSADQAIEQCLPFIFRVIRHLEGKFECHAGDLLNDFVQEGYLAVLKALGKFKPSRGVEFTTYAYYFIYGAIYKAFTEELSHGQNRMSIDIYDPDSEEYIGNFLENVPADSVYDADYGFTSKAQREDCEWLLKRIKDERDREIVRLRHGLVDGCEHSLKAIAFGLGISPERARQLYDRAFKQLQAAA